MCLKVLHILFTRRKGKKTIDLEVNMIIPLNQQEKILEQKGEIVVN